MGSEIFRLKSVDLEPTVVRGARSGLKNATTTRPLSVNPGDVATVYSGEQGVNHEYLVQSSLSNNDFKGAAVFTNGSDVVSGYTAPHSSVNGDIIRHDGDTRFYTVTGMDGTNVYLTEKYAKASPSDPNVVDGQCTVRRITLGSVNYESYEGGETGVPFYFDKEITEWKPTGADSAGPYVAFSGPIDFSTGMQVQFLKATSKSAPDLSTIGSVRKTLVDNNKQDVVDVSLSPMPYPHSSLKVWWGIGESGLQQKTEFEDYVVNYSQSPDFAYPYPPYEERNVAYLKFLERLTDEVQVTGIGPETAGIVAVSKEVTVQSSGAKARKPVQRIIYGTDSVKVGSESVDRQRDYVMDYDAGTFVFVKHKHAEMPYDHAAVPREVMWNGVSVIRNVSEADVRNTDDLVIPGITGLEGISGIAYFEDTDENNLVFGNDYVLEYTSGAIRLNTPLNKNQAVLVSYYVEGEDVETEKLGASDTRFNKYPILRDSVSILKRWTRTDQYGRSESGSTVLVEGSDYEMSYFTGHIHFLNPSSYAEDVVSLDATYTPLSLMNCILQPAEDDKNSYRMTVIGDALTVVEAKEYLFKIENPVVSVPSENYFKKPGDPTKFSFGGSPIADAPLYASILGTGSVLDTSGWTYDDQTRQLKLDKSLNLNEIFEDDTVIVTYSFVSDLLPYAPVQVTYPVISGGTSRFLIEGFDRTDIIRSGTILRIDNRDPVARYYFKVVDSTYASEGTWVTVSGTFPEDINAPLFFVLDAPVVWESMPETSVLEEGLLLGAEQLTFSGGTLEVQQSIKPNTILMVDDTDIYNVMSVEVSGADTVIGIHPPLSRPYPVSVVHSRTPVYDIGGTTLAMEHYVLGDLPEPAFTVSFTPPEGFDGSGRIFIDQENVVLFESINGVPNPVPYVYRKLNYPSVSSLSYAIQATKSTYNDYVEVGPHVPDYCPFTISPADSDDEKYFLDAGNYSADLIIPFDQFAPVRIPYTVSVSPELLRWSLLKAYSGQSSLLVKDADLTGRYVDGDLFAFAGGGMTGALYLGVTGVSVEDVDDRKYSRILFKDSFRTNLFDPAMYFKRGVRWVTVPNTVLSQNDSGTILTLGGQMQTMLKPGTLLKFDGKYVHAVESAVESVNSVTLSIYPPIKEGYSILGRTPGNWLEQSDVPICLSQIPDQPYILFEYTPPYRHVGTGSIVIDSDKVVVTESVDGGQEEKVTTFKFSDYANIPELATAITDLDSVVSGYKPFKVTVPDAYVGALSADSFYRYRLSPCDAFMPYMNMVAVGTVLVDYSAPAGYTGVGQMVVSATSTGLREDVMPVAGGDVMVKTNDISHSGQPSFFSLLGIIESMTSAADPTFKPFSVSYLDTRSFVGGGSWSSTHVQGVLGPDHSPLPAHIHVTTDFEGWQALGPLNIRRMEPETDYSIDAGLVGIESPIEDLDRFSLSYMGRDLRSEDEGKSISITCRYFSSLPAGSRLDIYMDYRSVDQYYLQKLTERKFSDLVVIPQLSDLLQQMGSGNGQGSDTAPTDDTIQNWNGGVTNNYYLLQDEEIKKQLFMKFYRWYKQRLRCFSSELQLSMGFKFAKSNAVGEVDGRLTLQDAYVETEDYTLSTEDEISSVPEGYSKFFPIGYSKQSPRYYPRFGKEYRLYNDVYCFNVRYKYHNGKEETIGYIKSIKPYWTKDLDHVILKNTNDNLVAYYEVPISEDERTFEASDAKYSWLRRLSVGDKVNLVRRKNKYTVMEITSGVDSSTGKTYELIKLDRSFSEKGVRKFRLRQSDGVFYYWVLKPLPVPPFVVPVDKKTESEFLAALPGEGRNLMLTRPDAESFPIFDDEGSYGYKLEGGVIEGYDKDDKRKNRIRKFSLVAFLKALFPLIPIPEIPENVRVQIGTYNEDTLEFTPTAETTVVEIDKLSRIEQRKVSSTQEGLYINQLDDDEVATGIKEFAYLDFETVYTPDDEDGYIESFVLRSKDRDVWVRFIVEYDENGDAVNSDVAEEYGFIGNQVYKGFYDPDNIYRWLLMEKQAWQTEEAILKDLYDYNDKIARAFNQAKMRLDNVSPYKGYLANYIAGQPSGISDWLATRLPKYERALYFLIGGYSGYGDSGSLLGVMRPDGVHDENDATPQIAQSYGNASVALGKYQSFYNTLQEYKYINSVNNQTWKSDYVRWALSLVQGLMHQKTARSMYDSLRKIEVGLVETNALSLSVAVGTKYTITGGSYSVSSDNFYLYATLVDTTDPQKLVPPYSRVFSLKTEDGSAYITLKALADLVSATVYEGINLFTMSSTYIHYPYELETCKLIVRGTWVLGATNHLSLTNVEDHRGSDPRVLFLDRMVEDKVTTDNKDDRNNPYWVWPLYTSNGNTAKKAIEGLPVAGSWEVPSADYYDVMRVRCLDCEWSTKFDDFGDDGDGIIDAKTYMGPTALIDKIQTSHSITIAEFRELVNEVDVNMPRVSILKAINFVRHGINETTLNIDLREHATITDLVATINAARFTRAGEQDLNGDLQLFEAQSIGDENHGRFKSYEISVEYVPVKDYFEVVDNNFNVVDSKFDFQIGWKLLEKSANKGSYLTFKVRPQRYSMDPFANFLMDGPEEAYQNTLLKLPLGLRKDINAFDVYCWDDEDSEGRREYEVSNNVMYFRSANVPSIAVPLSQSGDENAPDRETLKQLVDRINANPLINKRFYANLQFTRDDARDPGYFEYGYLPNFKRDVPKATLQDFVLRKDNALRLHSSETAEYLIEPDGPYNPLDLVTVFNSLRLRIRSSVRAMSVGKGSGYTFSSSSMVVDDVADTLDLSATYSYSYNYSRTFQFSDVSYDTISELVTALNAVTIPGVGGALFSAVLNNADACTSLLQSSGVLSTTPVQLYKQKAVPPPLTETAFTLAITTPGGICTLSNASYTIPASRSQIRVSCTITYMDTYTPATTDISSGNYTVATLSAHISTLKPFLVPEFPVIFPSTVFNSEYSGTDASNLQDVTTTVEPTGYASVQVLESYDFSGKTLSDIATDVTTDTARTGVSAAVIGEYGYAESNLLVPSPSYSAIVVQKDLEADFRGLIGLRLLNMFNPSYATFYDKTVEIVADGNYGANLPVNDKDLHGWIDSVRGSLLTGMLGVQVLPIKVEAVPYGVPAVQSQALTYNVPTHVYFGAMGDIKFVQISDYNLHVQTNYVKRRLGKPWSVDGVVQLDHYTPERYDGLDNPDAIDMEHFLGWLRDTRYMQIKDGVINEALVSNKYLWLFMKFHREFGCDQRAYQLRKRIAEGKDDQETIGSASG